MNKNLGFDTLNMIDLFENKIDTSSVILHIPHSSTFIPSYEGFVSREAVETQIELLTDFHTEKIFDINGITKIVTPFSRVFCDVERLKDADEIMFKSGRGFFYTHSDNGNMLRIDMNGFKETVYNDYYLSHHSKLKQEVENKLNQFGTALIIDCHSFSDTPFESDIDKELKRPDICIGTDSYHTPKHLLDLFVNHFWEQGFTVGVNHPYSGTMIPMDYYHKNSNVHGIMIEVNRKLYIDFDNVKTLNEIITELFKTL